MKKKKSGIGTKLLMAALFLGVAGYFGIQAFQYLDDPLGIILAYRYEVEQAVDMTGYVVREERVLPDEGGGLLRIQRAEGERVAAGGTVASVYADQASLDRQAEIDSLESRVEQLQYAQNLALAAETTRKLDAQIAQNLLEYRRLLAADRLYDAESVVLELRALVLKRDYSNAGGEDAALQLQELGAQLLTLRSQAEGTVRRVTAPEAGLYSAEVDGYETVLTPEALDGLTPSGLAALTANPADPAAVSRTGKLVLGDEWRYAAVLPFEDAAALQSLQAESGGNAVPPLFQRGGPGLAGGAGIHRPPGGRPGGGGVPGDGLSPGSDTAAPAAGPDHHRRCLRHPDSPGEPPGRAGLSGRERENRHGGSRRRLLPGGPGSPV